MELTIAEVHEAVTRQVSERDCVVAARRRISYGQFNERTHAMAGFLLREGFGCRQARETLQPWESGQDHIGLFLYNCPEYLECEFGFLKARAVAVNVNYRYVERELTYLFRNAKLRGVVYQSALADSLSRIRSQLPELRLLVQVPDESGAVLLPGAIWYEDALAAGAAEFRAPQCSPDDLHILYTGGTTGLPKGVLWRQADILVAALGGRRPDGTENAVSDFVRCAEKSASRTLPAGPFMHASGRWPSMSQLLLGNTVIIPTNTRRLDPDDIWTTVEREKVVGINIAGDAFARPLLEQLSRKSYALTSLRMISSGAAVLSVSVKKELLKRLPHIQIGDTIGASETGPQASTMVRSGDEIATPQFSLTSSTTILSDDLATTVPRDSSETGWLARSGRIPLGYLGDEEKTRATFRTLGGIRYAVPGDRARWSESGDVELLGRDASTINSGGEKVYAEEVEMALKHHAAVYDAIVCGRPSERWGQEVVAIVRLRTNMPVSVTELLEECGKHIARYKLPKAFIFRDEIRRSVSGKPDYDWARAQAIATQSTGAASRGPPVL